MEGGIMDEGLRNGMEGCAREGQERQVKSVSKER